ncbi:hypothetical protein R4I72_05795 [Leclercia adecarboxylata]|uniref:hypothetical protein n=1 Tax=Leclercia adecarboxylata TaxID=83655 RepID=UPI0027BB8320|nr:hypothetical protein [Leclercia adecarboxylata]MDQ2127960.1 hypothetical protein [Leclercia adecarboxylata]MDV7056573.1 hypothetical protein [Leclercia adecarboxylata]
MRDFSPLIHAAVAVILQCSVGQLSGWWAAGGVIGCMWFIAREHTQAEYRWIAQFGAGKRANMPWWGGFDWRTWNLPSLLDWLVPVAACTSVYFVSTL